MLEGVRGELLLEALGGVAGEPSAAVWLLNFGCRHDVVHAIGLRVNGRRAIATTKRFGLGEPAVRLVEAGIAFERLGLTLLLDWYEGLSAALPSIGWHIFVRVVF